MLQFRKWLVASLAACVLVTVPACNDSGGSDSPSPTVDVTGHWSGVSSANIRLTIDLIQNGANVTGTSTAGGETGTIVGHGQDDFVTFLGQGQ